MKKSSDQKKHETLYDLYRIKTARSLGVPILDGRGWTTTIRDIDICNFLGKEGTLDAYTLLIRLKYKKRKPSPSDVCRYLKETLLNKRVRSTLSKSKLKSKKKQAKASASENENTLKIFVSGSKGCWLANFKIGVQSFHVCERETKKEALWYCKCLRIAFKNLITGSVPKKNVPKLPARTNKTILKRKGQRTRVILTKDGRHLAVVGKDKRLLFTRISQKEFDNLAVGPPSPYSRLNTDTIFRYRVAMAELESGGKEYFFTTKKIVKSGKAKK